MRRSTVQRATRVPSRLSCAHTLSAPYTERVLGWLDAYVNANSASAFGTSYREEQE
jgi:hypothetical protein